jgi:hypothetical protein
MQKDLMQKQNIGNFTTPVKPHNIGTHLKGIETSFQVVPLFLKSFHFWVSYITFRNSAMQKDNQMAKKSAALQKKAPSRPLGNYRVCPN